MAFESAEVRNASKEIGQMLPDELVNEFEREILSLSRDALVPPLKHVVMYREFS